MALSVFSTDPKCRIAHQGPLMVMCLTGATRVEDLDTLSRCQDLVCAKHPRTASITVMNAGYLNADKAVIERGAEMSKKFEKFNAGGIIVINSKGLSAVIARTALAAFSMFSPNAAGLHVVKTIADGVAKANEVLKGEGVSLSQKELDEVLEFINA